MGQNEYLVRNQINKLRDSYTNILKWSLTHKRWILRCSLVLLFSSFMLLGKGFIGTSFISPSDRGELNIRLLLAPQTSLYETNMLTQKVEKLLFEQPASGERILQYRLFRYQLRSQPATVTLLT